MARIKDKLRKSSRLIGPEDVRAGHYVTISETTWQVLCVPEDAACAPGLREPRVARVTGWTEDAGWPLRVIEVCLPFAFAVNPAGTHVAIDLRRHRLSRLSKAYGSAAFAALKKQEEDAKAASAPAAGDAASGGT